MDARDFVRPIRSMPRFQLPPSGATIFGAAPEDHLREALRRGEGDALRCATNIVVYGGDGPAAEAFVAAALRLSQPQDTIWRIGMGEARDPRIIWVGASQRLLSMLKARVLFLPRGEHRPRLKEEWIGRADVVFVDADYSQSPETSFVASFVLDSAALVVYPTRPLWGKEPALGDSPAFSGSPRWTTQVGIGYARVHPSEEGAALSEFRFECRSADDRVRATIEGLRGGELTAVFVTADPSLEGATIRLQFRTNLGGVLRGEEKLSRDQRDPSQFVAFWQGTQLDFETSQGLTSQQPEDAARLMFEFEILLPETRG